MQQQRKKYFKRRVQWLLDPWIIGTIVILLLSALPVVLWLASYDSAMAVWMFVITYLSLLVFLLGYIKRSFLEPELVHDKKQSDEALRQIAVHRVRTRKEYIQTELEVLARGERSPVLDIWQLNDELNQRHPFFSSLETVLMDPVQQELWIRVKVGKLDWRNGQDRQQIARFLNLVAEFIQVLASDGYLLLLQAYFKTVIIEIYSLKERENELDQPYPLYSSVLTRDSLERFKTVPPLWQNLSVLGQHRFANGADIEPHRGIEGSTTSGLL